MFQWLTEALGEQNATIAYILIVLIAVLIGFLILRAIWRGLRGGTYISGGRNREHRLAVIDATPIDNRRRLVLVRRDDVEHLILIGGMNDVLVERDINKYAVGGPSEDQISHSSTVQNTAAVTAAGALAGAALGATNATASEAEAAPQIANMQPEPTPEPQPKIAEDLVTAVEPVEITPPAPQAEQIAEMNALQAEPSVDVPEMVDAPELEIPLDMPTELAIDDIELAESQQPRIQDLEPKLTEPDPIAPPSVEIERAAPSQRPENIEDEMEDLLNQLTGSPKS